MRSGQRLAQEPVPTDEAPGTEAAALPGGLAVSQVLGLQRTAGNSAVGRMLSAGRGVLARQPPSAPPVPVIKVIHPPAARGPLVRHTPTNVDFCDDKAFVAHQLEEYADKHGVDAIDRFDKLGGTWMPAPENPLALPDQQAKVDDEYIERVRTLVHDECVTLRAHISQFVDDFEMHAHTTLMTALTDSEIRVKAELERLGIKSEEHLFGLYSTHKGADNAAAKKMATDAKALLAKFDEVKANSTLPHVVDAPPIWGEERSPAEVQRRAQARGEWQAASERLEMLKREYNLLRHDFETANPMAIGYQLDLGSGTTREHLAKLSDENAENRADKLGSDLKEKLENIQKVRKYAEDWKYVWRLEKIVDVTLERPEIKNHKLLQHDGVRRSAVFEKVGAHKASDEMTSVGAGIVLFALGMIAALPTGGLSMAGATAVAAAGGAELVLSIGVAVTAAQRYSMESAESGTDFDKAKVIADRDPDLLWLGLDILGALGAVAGVVARGREIFGHIHALREEAIGAKAAAQARKAAGMSEGAAKEWETAAERLRAEGNKAAPGAGDRLKREVESGQSRHSGVEEPEPPTVRPAEYDAAKLDAAALADEFPGAKTATQADAEAAYFAAIKANPDIEHGLVQHGVATDMWVYVEGTSREVSTAPFLKRNWVFKRHHHPKGQKFPSVGAEAAVGPEAAEGGGVLAKNLRKTEVTAKGDFAAAKQQALKSGEPVTEVIDWIDPLTKEMHTTRFGFNPRSETPFWFEIVGTEIRGEYKSLAHAEAGIKVWQAPH
jgi:hypothetical protein